MRIILAIDVIGGKCVRLTRGNYSTKKIYNIDPVEVAKQAEDNGIKYGFWALQRPLTRKWGSGQMFEILSKTCRKLPVVYNSGSFPRA